MNKDRVERFIMNWFPILLLIVLINTSGWAWGLTIYIVCMFIWGGYMVYLHWASVVLIRQTLETAVWGKPLTKEYWKPGELKNTKVKIVWKKKTI